MRPSYYNIYLDYPRAHAQLQLLAYTVAASANKQSAARSLKDFADEYINCIEKISLFGVQRP